MAESTPELNREAFVCSICLELLKEPVTIPCGHSYCMSCVHTHFNEEAWRRSYSCPQCRHNFTVRPVLVKNTMLAVLMEGLKKTRPPADQVYAAHGDVGCDLCTERKMKAVKSCLQCLVSYCKDHLQPHYDVAALKRHRLVEPTENLQDNICPQHDEVMKMFCRTDQLCICYLCSLDQHKGHDVVTAAEERTERQKELDDNKRKILHQIDVKEKNVRELEQKLEKISTMVDTKQENKITRLKEFTPNIEIRMSEVKQQIRSQQEDQERHVEDIQGELQQEIGAMERTLTQLDTLSYTDDNCQFLHNFASLTKLDEDSVSPTVNRAPFFPLVENATRELQRQIRDAEYPLSEYSKVDLKVRAIREEMAAAWDLKHMASFDIGLPVSRDELRQYACDVTLDPNTAHAFLALSAGNKKVTQVPRRQKYRKHPERFTHIRQVLSKDALPVRCYIEVVLNFHGDNDIPLILAVTYKDIQRKGYVAECCFGQNKKSWGLTLAQNDVQFFYHNRLRHEVWTTLYTGDKVGIYVDQEAGTLAFYDANSSLRMHEIRTTFTQPLYLGISLDGEMDSVKICKFK